jgi:hypothetical protein
MSTNNTNGSGGFPAKFLWWLIAAFFGPMIVALVGLQLHTTLDSVQRIGILEAQYQELFRQAARGNAGGAWQRWRRVATRSARCNGGGGFRKSSVPCQRRQRARCGVCAFGRNASNQFPSHGTVWRRLTACGNFWQFVA